MGLSGAGSNKQAQLIAVVGTWSLVGDDFGPYFTPSGFSKFQVYTTGTGGGGGNPYSIKIYTMGFTPEVEAFVRGTWSGQVSANVNANRPPQFPNAAYGAAAVAAGVTEDQYAVAIAPSAQGGTGPEANPLICTGAQSQVLLLSYPVWAIRAKVTSTSAGAATGTVNVFCLGIP